MVMSQPAWEIATLFPSQGEWTEEEYLAFSAVHPRVEFCDGRIEVLPVPSDRHQAVLDAGQMNEAIARLQKEADALQALAAQLAPVAGVDAAEVTAALQALAAAADA